MRTLVQTLERRFTTTSRPKPQRRRRHAQVHLPHVYLCLPVPRLRHQSLRPHPKLGQGYPLPLYHRAGGCQSIAMGLSSLRPMQLHKNPLRLCLNKEHRTANLNLSRHQKASLVRRLSLQLAQRHPIPLRLHPNRKRCLVNLTIWGYQDPFLACRRSPRPAQRRPSLLRSLNKKTPPPSPLGSRHPTLMRSLMYSRPKQNCLPLPLMWDHQHQHPHPYPSSQSPQQLRPMSLKMMGSSLQLSQKRHLEGLANWGVRWGVRQRRPRDHKLRSRLNPPPAHGARVRPWTCQLPMHRDHSRRLSHHLQVFPNTPSPKSSLCKAMLHPSRHRSRGSLVSLVVSSLRIRTRQ